jgi:hypothetical protein
MADHGWLVNPKRRRRTKRMPAALARYWRTHRRRGRRIVRTRGAHRIHRRRRHRVHRGVATAYAASLRRGRIHHGGYGSEWLPSHYAGNPGLLKEVGMFGLNPRHHRRRRHHRGHGRHRYHKHHTFYTTNPRGTGGVGVMSMISRPMETVTNGLTGAVGVFLPIAIPNWLLPFPGTDIMSKAIRFATRAATAGLLLQFGGPMLGRYAQAFKAGAYIGVAGSTVLDFMGTNIVLGYGDTTQTPGRLLAGFQAPATTTTVAGLGAAYQRSRGMGAAYSRMGLRGLHGANAIGTGFKHGLLGGY